MKMLSLVAAVALLLAAVTQAAPPTKFAPKLSTTPKSINPKLLTPPSKAAPRVNIQPKFVIPPSTKPNLGQPRFQLPQQQPRVTFPKPKDFSQQHSTPRFKLPPSSLPRQVPPAGSRTLPGKLPQNLIPKQPLDRGRMQAIPRLPNTQPRQPNPNPQLPGANAGRPDLRDLFKKPNLNVRPKPRVEFDRSAIRPDIIQPQGIRPDLLEQIRPQDLVPRFPERMIPQPENDPGQGEDQNPGAPNGDRGDQPRDDWPRDDRPNDGRPIPFPDDWGPLPIPEQLPGGGDDPPNQDPPVENEPDHGDPDAGAPGENGHGEDAPDVDVPEDGLPGGPDHNDPGQPNDPHHDHGIIPLAPIPFPAPRPDIWIDLFCGNHNIGYCVPGVVIEPGVGLGQYVTPVEPERLLELPRVENGDEVTLFLESPIVVPEGVELRAVLVVADRPVLIEVTAVEPGLVQVQLPTLLLTGREPATLLLGLSDTGDVVYSQQLLILPIAD